MRTVLITGGFGYVGGRVAMALQQSGKHQVLLATHNPANSVPSWLPEARVVQVDLTSDAGLEAACKGVSSIVHLAALNEHDCVADPQRAIQVNGGGTLRLLNAAKRAGVGRFVYFSTAHVYGAPLIGHIDETQLPRPTHPYAITHHVAEDFVLAAHDQQSLVGIVLRMSNGFGVPAHPAINRWTLIVNDLCRQATTTGKMVMRSPGLDQRDFITLEDAARAVEHVLDLPVAAVGDGLFNLGSGHALNMLTLANLIAERCKIVLNINPEIQRPEAPAGSPAPQLDYSTKKLLATGFSYSGSMVDEIDATLRLCRNAFGNANS